MCVSVPFAGTETQSYKPAKNPPGISWPEFLTRSSACVQMAAGELICGRIVWPWHLRGLL